jgi:hypothetical protein
VTRTTALLCALLLIASPIHAETNPFAWTPSARQAASTLSWGLVLGNVGMDTYESWKADDRGHAFKCQALRAAVVVGSTELVKRVSNRVRPDGSDDRSFWSGHAANAMAASGWDYRIGITIGIGTGYLRLAANKHYLSDVIVGSAVGLAVSRICR